MNRTNGRSIRLLSASVVILVAALALRIAGAADAPSDDPSESAQHDDLSPAPLFPERLPEQDSVVEWERVGSGIDVHWRVLWRGDAVTAARVLSSLVARRDAYEYSLTPADADTWEISARIGTDGAGEPAGPPPDASVQEDVATVLRRRPNRSVPTGTGTPEASVPAALDRSPPGPPAGAGSGGVRFTDGRRYSWRVLDRVLRLEPAP